MIDELYRLIDLGLAGAALLVLALALRRCMDDRKESDHEHDEGEGN